jgi:phosphodiesterase/alkaline phosphatase D-like protein
MTREAVMQARSACRGAARLAAITVCACLSLGGATGVAAKSPKARIKWAWSGGVTSTSAVVKARVSLPGSAVRLSLSPGAAGLSGPHEARADADGLASFALDGLTPATRYRYRLEIDGADAVDGGFGTFTDGPARVRIAFASCAKTGSASPVFDAIRAASPDLFIHMGDFHYRNIAANDPARFKKAYDDVLASPTQRRLYLEVPIAYMWDDHDFGGNNANSASASKPAATAVYRRFVPHYPLDGEDADGGTDGIYQAFRLGRVRVIVIDARSERTSNRGAPGSRTILGPRQLQWLKDQLTAAKDAPLVVWVNPVPWIATQRSGSDDWGSYSNERREIANHIDQLGLARRLVMLSGDAHMVAIDDGTHSNYSTGPSRGTRGFPVMHAAPLDRWTTRKGGPYSHGETLKSGQFGFLDVTDDGGALTVELTGRDRQGVQIPGKRLVLRCGDAGCEPE